MKLRMIDEISNFVDDSKGDVRLAQAINEFSRVEGGETGAHTLVSLPSVLNARDI
jgi:hypothetical protein